MVVNLLETRSPFDARKDEGENGRHLPIMRTASIKDDATPG